MNIVLWILQGLLGLMFLFGGSQKAMKSKDELKESGGDMAAWVDSLSDNTVRAIGGIEFLIGLGLILPHLTGILPWLTPLAAVGLVCTMIGAALLHAQRGDGAQPIMINFVIGLLGAFVAYGRFILVPA